MSEWKGYILEDVIERFIDYRGKTPTKTFAGVPLVTAKIVKDGRILEPNEFIAVEDYDRWMTRGFPEINDVVLTTEAPLGEVALIKDNNIALAQRIITMRGKRDVCFSPFLKYYFQAPIGQLLLQSRSQGSTVEGIKAAELKKLEISLPPIEEQRAIAEVLSSLDDKIDLLHRQNKTLESLAQTLFRHWFIDLANDDWREGTLADFAYNVREGIQPNAILPDTKYVGLEHIERKHVALHSFGAGADVASNKSVFKKHDILFGKLRPYFHKVCFAPFDGICSTDILVIRPKSSNLFSFCVMAFFLKDVVDHSDIASEGTRMPRTNWEILSSYPISIPDEETIIRFNETVSPMIFRIEANIIQIASLTATRDAILPKLMYGEANCG